MRIPTWPVHDERELALLRDVLESGRWGGFNEIVTRFEQSFAAFQQCAHGIGAVNGTVTLETALGKVRIRMEPDWAPNHVRNFLKLVSTGWYDGTAFHRLVKGFVLQGGMPNTRLGNPTHPADRWVHTLKGEFRPGIKHVRGIVSMARGDDPDSADTSFFLMLGDAPYLDGKYSAFGRVVSGMEVLDAFEKEEVDGETPKRRLELIQATIDK